MRKIQSARDQYEASLVTREAAYLTFTGPVPDTHLKDPAYISDLHNATQGLTPEDFENKAHHQLSIDLGKKHMTDPGEVYKDIMWGTLPGQNAWKREMPPAGDDPNGSNPWSYPWNWGYQNAVPSDIRQHSPARHDSRPFKGLPIDNLDDVRQYIGSTSDRYRAKTAWLRQAYTGEQDDGRGLSAPPREWDTTTLDPRIDMQRLIDNAVSRYNGATDEQREAGRNWYNGARIWLKNFVDKNGGDYSRAAAMMAALSPQLSWEKNLEGGAHFLRTFDPNDRAKWQKTDENGNVIGATGLPMLGTNVQRAMDVYDAEDPRDVMGRDDWGAEGPKIHSFWKNFLGDENYATIDKHMLRALDRAYGEDPLMSYGGKTKGYKLDENGEPLLDEKGEPIKDLSPEDQRVAELETMLKYKQTRAGDGAVINTGYNTYAEAIRRAAQQINDGLHPSEHITPAQLQAIVWTQHKADMDAFEERGRKNQWLQKDQNTFNTQQERARARHDEKRQKNPALPEFAPAEYDGESRWNASEKKRLEEAPRPNAPKWPMPNYEEAVDYGSRNPYGDDSPIIGPQRPSTKNPNRFPPKREQELESTRPNRSDFGVNAPPPVPVDNIPDSAPTYDDMYVHEVIPPKSTMGQGLPMVNNNVPGQPRRRDHLEAALDTIRIAGALLNNSEQIGVDAWNHAVSQEYPGVTLKNHLGDAPTSGFMVSLPGTEEKIPYAHLSPQDITDYYDRREPLIKQPGNSLGGWKDDAWWYNDVSKNIGNPWQAAQQAEDTDQLAIYDLNRDRGVDTDAAMHELFNKGQAGYYMAMLNKEFSDGA